MDPEISKTQADLITDIFGDDDDDFNDQPVPVAPPAAKQIETDELDEIFKDSDDDEPSAVKKTTGKLKKSGGAVVSRELVDSDDEQPVKKSKDHLTKKIKKRKLNEDEDREKDRSQKKKLLKSSGDKSATKDDANPFDSGDEYNSGEEKPETTEDRDFIDAEDDHAELMDEYNGNQNFDEELDDEEGYNRNKKGNKSSAASRTSSSSGLQQLPTKELDPLSQMLAEMKRKKKIELTDAEKDLFVSKLQQKMEQAVKLDDQAYRRGEPAVYKVKFLPFVQQIVGMKAFHNTLLERDFLCNLRDWIEPRDAETLPALAVRVAVYETLLKLPVMLDHLKRTTSEKPPIGVTIVALRKHKKETPENKRLLKEIMDRWARPIFNKSTVIAGATSGGANDTLLSSNPLLNAEVHQALLQKYHQSAATATASEDANSNVFTGMQGNNEEKKVDIYQRARAPTSAGFLFTVQPQMKNVERKQNLVEKALGEERMKLYKKMTDTKAGLAGGGRKQNLR